MNFRDHRDSDHRDSSRNEFQKSATTEVATEAETNGPNQIIPQWSSAGPHISENILDVSN